MKLIHYINGNLSDKCGEICIENEKNIKKYKFFLDNITNYIYITDRLVFQRENDEYIFELNIGKESTCKIYLKTEKQELFIDVISANYKVEDEYIDIKYVLETDNDEHHIILEIGDN